MIEEGLFEYLSNVAPVRALIEDSATFVRMYPLVIPDGGKGPCVVYRFSGFDRTQTDCGTIKLATCDVQLDAYASTYAEVLRLKKAIFDALNDFVGMMGSVEVRRTTLQTETDLEEPEPGLLRRLQSWELWYVES